jgi:hypothetical protein
MFLMIGLSFIIVNLLWSYALIQKTNDLITLDLNNNITISSLQQGFTIVEYPKVSKYENGLFPIASEITINLNKNNQNITETYTKVLKNINDGLLMSKISMLIIWLVSWAFLFIIGHLSHIKKIKIFHHDNTTTNKNHLYVLIIIAIMSFAHITYLAFSATGPAIQFIGVFGLYLMVTLMIAMWLQPIFGLTLQQKQSSIQIIIISFIISGLLMNFKIFDYIHLFMVENFSFYSYKNRINNGFMSAFSTTFISRVMPIICLFIFIIYRKKITLFATLSVLGALVVTGSMWAMHHYSSAKVVAIAESLREDTNQKLIFLPHQIIEDNKHLIGLKTFQINKNLNFVSNEVLENLIDKNCLVCKTKPNEEIKSKEILSRLIDNSANNQYEHMFFAKQNVRLVEIMAKSVGDDVFIMVNDHRPSFVSFSSVSYSMIVFIPMILFWWLLPNLLVILHNRYKNKS